MEALLAGKEVYLPIFNFKKGVRTYDTTPKKLGENDILVIEGIHCLNPKLTEALSDENKFKIYILSLIHIWAFLGGNYVLFRGPDRRNQNEKRHCGCHIRVCQASEEREFLFWSVSFSQRKVSLLFGQPGKADVLLLSLIHI